MMDYTLPVLVYFMRDPRCLKLVARPSVVGEAFFFYYCRLKLLYNYGDREMEMD